MKMFIKYICIAKRLQQSQIKKKKKLFKTVSELSILR